MQTIVSSNLEFGLYESMVYGELRPFLQEHSSTEYSERLVKTQEKELGCDAYYAPTFHIEREPHDSGYLIGEVCTEDVETSGHWDIESGKLLEFDKPNIPHPPDKKAEYFLSLIENEFDEIKKRAKKFLHDGQKDGDIAQFVNQNIQKAKKIAVDSGHLSRNLKEEYSDSSGDSDAYIISVLGHFLIQSVLFYQNLFEQYLKNPPDSEDELRAYVENPYTFAHKGDYWKINFNGEEALIKDLERVRYIVHLLDNPQKELYCHELMALVKGLNPEIDPNYSKMGEDKLKEENLSLVDLMIENLSPDDKDNMENVAYATWERARDLSLSPSMKEKAKKEWDRVRGYLWNEHGVIVSESKKGLSFKLKTRLKPEFEKARSNVTKHINSAIKGIEKIIPLLSGHLKNAIATGAKCCYRPDPNNPIEWTILWNN